MSNRLDTELRDITESISMLKSNSSRPNENISLKKIKKKDIEVSSQEMILSEGFEDRLMNRVKDALKGIMD